MATWILASVQNFYRKSQDIIKNKNSSFYLEFYSMQAKQYKLLKITDDNESEIQSMVMNGLSDYSYRNFAIITDDKDLNLSQSVYSQSDNVGKQIIDGMGGRENAEEIECIYLRILYKEPDKNTKSLYSKIITILKKDPDFRQGFDSTSSMSRRALYDVNIVHKVKKFDLKKPLSLISLQEGL